MISISYAITVCNELEEIIKLLNFLQLHIRPEDEIVIQYDSTSATQEVKEYFPELVGGTEETGYIVYYTQIIPIIVEAIQTQTKTLEGYEKEIEELELEIKRRGLI